MEEQSYRLCTAGRSDHRLLMVDGPPASDQGLDVRTIRGETPSEPTQAIQVIFNKIGSLWQERTQEHYHFCNQWVTGIFRLIFKKYVWMPPASDQGLRPGRYGGETPSEPRWLYDFFSAG